MAGVEVESRIHDFHRIQKGASVLITPELFGLTTSQQLLANIDRVSKSHHQGKGGNTVFDEILDSRLSEEDKKPLRLLQEAQTFSIAGTESTSWLMSVCHTRACSLHLITLNFLPRS